jgi:hypothetical protein
LPFSRNKESELEPMTTPGKREHSQDLESPSPLKTIAVKESDASQVQLVTLRCPINEGMSDDFLFVALLGQVESCFSAELVSADKTFADAWLRIFGTQLLIGQQQRGDELWQYLEKDVRAKIKDWTDIEMRLLDLLAQQDSYEQGRGDYFRQVLQKFIIPALYGIARRVSITTEHNPPKVVATIKMSPVELSVKVNLQELQEKLFGKEENETKKKD